MSKAIMAGALLAAAGAASADVFITEWMYSGTGGEFVELYATTQTDFTGWSYDDDSQTPGGYDLSAAGVVDAGTFVIFAEDDAATFISDWNLGAAVTNGDVVVLGNVSNNLGRNDEINIYDGASALVDRLTFGDQNIPGSIRTQEVSGITDPSNWGANDVFGWYLSDLSDGVSWTSANGDVGNPGALVPTPASAALIGLGGLVATRRRR